MAEQENTATEQNGAQQAPAAKGARGKIMPWLITALAVVICAGAGFLVGRSFGTRGAAQTASGASQAGLPEATHTQKRTSQAGNAETWFYELEPVLANLNEPGVTRYVRVALTLEIGNALEEKDGRVFLEQKKPLLKHWLTLYLSNQTIENVRGEKSLRQMQSQIADALNQGLFPDARPGIVRVLFKELSVQ